jgi:hypothetical protein
MPVFPNDCFNVQNENDMVVEDDADSDCDCAGQGCDCFSHLELASSNIKTKTKGKKGEEITTPECYVATYPNGLKSRS